MEARLQETFRTHEGSDELSETSVIAPIGVGLFNSAQAGGWGRPCVALAALEGLHDFVTIPLTQPLGRFH
jgi:hypothetical protein